MLCIVGYPFWYLYVAAPHRPGATGAVSTSLRGSGRYAVRFHCRYNGVPLEYCYSPFFGPNFDWSPSLCTCCSAHENRNASWLPSYLRSLCVCGSSFIERSHRSDFLPPLHLVLQLFPNWHTKARDCYKFKLVLGPIFDRP